MKGMLDNIEQSILLQVKEDSAEGGGGASYSGIGSSGIGGSRSNGENGEDKGGGGSDEGNHGISGVHPSRMSTNPESAPGSIRATEAEVIYQFIVDGDVFPFRGKELLKLTVIIHTSQPHNIMNDLTAATTTAVAAAISSAGAAHSSHSRTAAKKTRKKENVKCILSNERFENFLGFMKGRAKFQDMFPGVLAIPPKVFTATTVQKVFAIIHHHQATAKAKRTAAAANGGSPAQNANQDSWLKNYINTWKKDLSEYDSRMGQLLKTASLTSVRHQMVNIEQKIKRLPVNSNNIRQIYIGLERSSQFLESEVNQARIRDIISRQFSYQLRGLIGKGAYGLVYAIDLDHNQNQAIKIQINQNHNAAEFKKCEEIQNFALQSLDGDVLHFFKFFQVQDIHSKEILDFFIMERGEMNLKQLTQQQLSNNETVRLGGSNDFSHYWTKVEIRNLFMGIMRNVAFLHSINYYHRDIKYDNIIKKRQTYYLIDFNVSEKIECVLPLAARLDHAKDKATLWKQDYLQGTLGYLTPQWDMKYNAMRKAQQQQPRRKPSPSDVVGIHDPFKSDIYSLGVVFLQFLNNVKLMRTDESEIFKPSKDQKRAFSLAADVSKSLLENRSDPINVNQYFTETHQYLMDDQIFEVENLLISLLEPKETDRISTLKLSLICQLFNVVINNFVNLYSDHFPPEEIPKINENLCISGTSIEQNGTIKYKFKNQEYVGNYVCRIESRNRKIFIREGYGELYEFDSTRSNLRSLLYIGRWKNDLPDGEGKFFFFSGSFSYVGQFKLGVFHGKGTIYYNNPVDSVQGSKLPNQFRHNNTNDRHAFSSNMHTHQQYNQLYPHQMNIPGGAGGAISSIPSLGLPAQLVNSQVNYNNYGSQFNKPSQSNMNLQTQQYVPVVIYQGVFYNFILKEWLFPAKDILGEHVKYQIRLNANRDEYPLYVTVSNHGRHRVIEMSIKAYKNYGQYVSIFQTSRFDTYELHLVQDDCSNSHETPLIFGPINAVILFYESDYSRPVITMSEYIRLILFAQSVEEINFEFLPSSGLRESSLQQSEANLPSWGDICKHEGVREAMRECRSIRSLQSLRIRDYDAVVRELQYLEELDLSRLESAQIVSIGLVLHGSKVGNMPSMLRGGTNITTIQLSQFQSKEFDSLFESDYFSCVTSFDFSDSLISPDCLLKLFCLPGAANIKHLNLSSCPTLTDEFFATWNAMNETTTAVGIRGMFQRATRMLMDNFKQSKKETATTNNQKQKGVNKCENLEVLILSRLSIKLERFLPNAKHLSHLSELVIQDMPGLTDATVKAMLTNCAFEKSITMIQLAYNPLLTYNVFAVCAHPKFEKLVELSFAYCCDLNESHFTMHESQQQSFELPILKVPRWLSLVDLCNFDFHQLNMQLLTFLQLLQNSSFTVQRFKFALEQIDEEFILLFREARILWNIHSLLLRCDPSQTRIEGNLAKFLEEFLELPNKQLFFITDSNSKSDEILLIQLQAVIPSNVHNVFINAKPFNTSDVPFARPTKIFNEIQLLEIPLKMEMKGRVPKLVRHEKFREKIELDLSGEAKIGTDVIESLVISDHSVNLRILDLSNSEVSDSDINLFCNNGQFEITTLRLNNCSYISEQSINWLLTAKSHASLQTLQVRGIHRDLSLINLNAVNKRGIQLILDRVSIRNVDNVKRFIMEIKPYLKSHSAFLEKIRIHVLNEKILNIFIQSDLAYPNVDTLEVNFVSAAFLQNQVLGFAAPKQKAANEDAADIPHHLQEAEAKTISVDLIICLLSKILSINHLVLTFDELFIQFLLQKNQRNDNLEYQSQQIKPWIHRLSDEMKKLQNIKSIHFKQEWTDICVSKILNEDQIESFYLFLLSSMNTLVTKISFKLNMSPYMWNIMKKQRLSDLCVLQICTSLTSFNYLECLTLQLGGWGHQNNNITNQSIIQLTKMITNIENSSLKKINLDLSYWAAKNIHIQPTSIFTLLIAIQLKTQLSNLSINIAGWGQNMLMTDEVVKEEFSKISTLGYQSVTSFSLNVSDWTKLSSASRIAIIDFTDRCFKSLTELTLDMSKWTSFENTLDLQVIYAISTMLRKKPDLRVLSLNLSASAYGRQAELKSSDIKLLADSIEPLRELKKLQLILNGWSNSIEIVAVAQLTNAITSLSKLAYIQLELENWPQYNEKIQVAMQAMEQLNFQEEQQQTKKYPPIDISVFLKTNMEEPKGSTETYENEFMQFIRNIQQLVTLPFKKFNFDGWGIMQQNISKLLETAHSETFYVPSYQTTEKTNNHTLP